MNTFAMLFPGQGCQKIGMLKPFKEFSFIKNIFNESSEILKYNLWKVIENGPYEILNKTEIIQPAVLATSFAIWKIWKKFSGNNPQFMAGHSLGEYSALVCANGLSFADAIKVVALRGKFMQESVRNQEYATSAIIGLSGNPGQTNYSASKFGLIGFTHSLSREVAKRGITVNMICPGFIETDMTRILSKTNREKILSCIPTNRFGSTQDIAHAAIFLASEEASYITGETIHVNGGMYMK
uniref:[acyl-carrier-protein] S-malonyltransferase n=1 Tax=Glossina pallidipes TaxID=7398 RepID=A0A1A9Z0U7_GLOPL